jgi:hypothetical protein
MFGPKLSTVFASRWKALWWAAGVLFTAWTMVPAPDDTPAPTPAPTAHFDPWAKTGK